MKNRIKTAGQIAAFLAIFLMLLVPVSYMVRTNGEVKDRFSGFYAEKNDTLDIVMIGSSPVFPYYAAPKLWGETGIAMYPLASNMQRPIAMKYLVEEAEKSQSPELYIFEMRMYTIADEYLRSNMAYTRGITDNMTYSVQRLKTVKALVPEEEVESMLPYYMDLMKYHTNWKMLALPSEWGNMFYHKKSPYKGYTFRDDVGPQPMPDCGSEAGIKPIPEEQEAYLRELLDTLQNMDQEALFIVSPYGVTAEEQQMFNYMEEIVTSYGYTFLNMNRYYEEIGIVFEEDYADYGSHTNAVGAEKCTDFLENYLLEHYEFTDKRGDAAYASWDKSYKEWQEQMESARETIRERILNEEYAEIGATQEDAE